VKAAGRAVAVACAIALGGCGYFSWFGFGQDEAKKPMPLAEIAATANPKVAWSASVGKAGAYLFTPKVDGNRIFAAAADGTVSILDTENGRVVTRFDAQRKLASGAGGQGDLVIVSTVKGQVVAFDLAGKEKWAGSVGGEVLAPVVIEGKAALARTADGRIYSFALADGKRQWVYQRATPALLLRAGTGVITTPSSVVAGYPGGKLIALDLSSGKLTWEVTVSQPRGSTELERVADVAGLPVIVGDRICAAAFQGKVACFEILSGNPVWSRDLSTATGIAVDDTSVYLSDDQDVVHALSRDSGASRWKQDKLLRRGLSAPVIVDGKVIVGDSQGYLHVLSKDDGALIGRLSMGDGAVRVLVPALSGVLVQTSGGTLALVRF
jgi:outer membrane protein assembly factor BamB